MVSDMNRADDEVVVIYLLGSILNRTTADIELPEEVIKSHIILYSLLLNLHYFNFLFRFSLVWVVLS